MKRLFSLILCFLSNFLVTDQVTHDATNNSFIAFTIPEKDLIPENITYDPFIGDFYLRST